MWWRRGRRDEDFSEELRAHLAIETDRLIADGVPPIEARAQARRAFGNVAATHERFHESHGVLWLHHTMRDARYACRVLRRSPGFASIAVLTLALCIGANTAIYTVVDHVLLRPLPYPDPDRLAQIVTHNERKGQIDDEVGQFGSAWERLRDGASSVDVAATASGFDAGVSIVAGGEADYVQQLRVSAGFFRVLRVAPALGREFTADEDRPTGPAVAVLSDRLWRRVFHGDPAALGGTVTLRGEPYTVVGVMPARFQSLPASFQNTAPADVWTPARASRTGEGGGANYEILARLRPGVTWPQANAEVAALGVPGFTTANRDPGLASRLQIAHLQRAQTADARGPIDLLWAAVGVVLLIGCVNLAGLLSARAATRAPELATRIALGGGHGTIIGQLLMESLVLAACGGVTGIALAAFGMQALTPLLRDAVGVTGELTLDMRVLAITSVVSLCTSVIFGLWPAWQASRVDIRAALTESGGGGLPARRAAGRAAGSWSRRSR